MSHCSYHGTATPNVDDAPPPYVIIEPPEAVPEYHIIEETEEKRQTRLQRTHLEEERLQREHHEEERLRKEHHDEEKKKHKKDIKGYGTMGLAVAGFWGLIGAITGGGS
ncbi:hypothetical protein EK21DRAFT_114453 [Setomelanomma holmii]|uniref:Uncharacterized protein n=1 Tax=Setomelanomma holmii TaxID=210430 RepID=A0A9P4H6F8_9PLEO|nr:hypothetical protein EK21DRAFT_114453 [Setomelanomma holmii]